MKILMLPGSYTSPAARVRIWQFVEPLTRLGHQVMVRVTRPPRTWESSLDQKTFANLHNRLGSLARWLSAIWITRDVEHFDIVLMNRDILPGLRFSSLEPWLCSRNPHFIFDFDDAIHIGAREKKLRQILPRFAWLTPGNAYLAEFARQVNPNVSVWPTVVDTEKYQPVKERASGPIRIGWSGSDSTLRYCLPLLESALIRLAEQEEFEFIVIANVPPRIDWRNVRISYFPWTPETEVHGLQQIDIGLMPLNDVPFERGKCGLKAIQYMGVGVPALVSPVGVNREIVIHGENGYHCSDEGEWIASLRELIHNPGLRQKMGRAARERVEAFYSVDCLLPKMTEVFQRVANG